MAEARLVSVVMPVRNGRRYIAEAVASALAQGACVGEVVVVDDGSTDGTVDVVQGFTDPRVRLVSNPGRGVSAARNYGIGRARYHWIGMLDADDRVMPGAYDGLLAETPPGAVAIYGDYDRVDAEGRRRGVRHLVRHRRPKPSGDILNAILSANFIAVGAILVRREALIAIGGFAEDLRLCEDWLLWARLATRGPFVYRMGLHVNDYRIHHGSAMHRKAIDFASMAPVIDRMFEDPLVVAARKPSVLAACRARAETSLRVYVMMEAIRLKDWSLAAAEALAFARCRPGSLPTMTIKLAASMAGL